MLILTGTVMNGMIVSMVIAQVLQKYTPKMRYHVLHLLLIVFGFLHTLLGVQAQQIANHAESAGANAVLLLEWHWRFRDVICVANVASIGAVFSRVSGLGNEPSLCASFAAGVALRMFVHDHFADASGALLDRMTNGLPVQFVALEDVITRGGGGVGDCGGGPFRMLFGEEWSGFVVLGLRLFLLAIPLTALLQWTRRTISAAKKIGSRKQKFKKLAFCAMIAAVMALQCYMIARFSFNGINGTLAGFYISALIGCAWESVLGTYPVRGPCMQFFFLVVLIFI